MIARINYNWISTNRPPNTKPRMAELKIFRFINFRFTDTISENNVLPSLHVCLLSKIPSIKNYYLHSNNNIVVQNVVAE